jgi:hypothetical protein
MSLDHVDTGLKHLYANCDICHSSHVFRLLDWWKYVEFELEKMLAKWWGEISQDIQSTFLRLAHISAVDTQSEYVGIEGVGYKVFFGLEP